MRKGEQELPVIATCFEEEREGALHFFDIRLEEEREGEIPIANVRLDDAGE